MGRSGFTLIEALMASAILFAGVLTVISAVMSGQQKAIEAQLQVEATLAAEDLISRIVVDDYNFIDANWSGIKPAGSFFANIDIQNSTEDFTDLGIVVEGKMVTFQVFRGPTDMRTVVEIDHFIPKPVS